MSNGLNRGAMLCLGRRGARWLRGRLPFRAEQRATLVNVKVKWVKDRHLDWAVSRERHLRPALHLVHLISSQPRGRAALRDLATCHRQFALPHANIATFLRRFPTVFRESADPGGTDGPWFSLSHDALRLRRMELGALADAEQDLVDRLRRFLMLTADRSLPLHAIDQLRWDMGLPSDYHLSVVPRHRDFFELVRRPGDERIWLKLVSWDPRLAVSELQKSASSADGDCLAFPVSFTRGFGLKKKCMAWLREWQTLPYTSPYADASGLDSRTDVSEKRIVGVFHELLHLTIAKKTGRRNVSNLRKPLGLPFKFTKVFERHPGIFYLSQKLATQTVVLREAYGGSDLLIEHPLQEIREKYLALLMASQQERTKGD
ncbi:Plant organelle RNA recognition domain [Musa troglodytarum]|uniref:Plant organelle RNA recognition domain n=2 Tax=Musa troglodytarum TaxID=320322 RepID=A0A9E7HB21_9LILI|nr:Plant organelle RNA recognition domain [Musa troglodytarum]